MRIQTRVAPGGKPENLAKTPNNSPPQTLCARAVSSRCNRVEITRVTHRVCRRAGITRSSATRAGLPSLLGAKDAPTRGVIQRVIERLRAEMPSLRKRAAAVASHDARFSRRRPRGTCGPHDPCCRLGMGRFSVSQTGCAAGCKEECPPPPAARLRARSRSQPSP